MVKKSRKQIERKKSSEADIVSISGCMDSQTSADAQMAGRATGAMSFAFITAVKQNRHPTLINLLNQMRDLLVDKKFEQVPQMSTGHIIDPNLPWDF